MERIICRKCQVEKLFDKFGRDKHSKSGFNSICKECINARNREKYDKEAAKLNNIKNIQWRKDFYRSDRGIEVSRRSYLKQTYNITLEYYNELNDLQNGVCAICQQPEVYYRNKVLCVDHDHLTGEIRGLLCNTCNRALGLLKENKEILFNAFKYLEKHEFQNQSIIPN